MFLGERYEIGGGVEEGAWRRLFRRMVPQRHQLVHVESQRSFGNRPSAKLVLRVMNPMYENWHLDSSSSIRAI